MSYYLCLLPILLSTGCALLPYTPPKGTPDPASVALEKRVVAVPQFQYLYSISDLPSDLRAVLVHAAKTDHIANPGEPFNTTDAIFDLSWPFVQHQFSAVSDTVGIVVYRQGGFAPFQRALMLERGGSAGGTALHQVRLLWRCPFLNDQRSQKQSAGVLVEHHQTTLLKSA